MKVEGRKSHLEERPEVVALAKALARKRPKGGQLEPARRVGRDGRPGLSERARQAHFTRRASRRC